MPRCRRSSILSSATAMIAELPGGMLSPICRSSSSLMPLSLTLPQMPPAPAPTAALARIVGGKIRPTRPPAIAPRLAHFLPLGSAVSLKWTFPSVPCTIAAASISSIVPSRSMALKSLTAASASSSFPKAATNTSTVLVAMCLSFPSVTVCPRAPRWWPRSAHTTARWRARHGRCHCFTVQLRAAGATMSSVQSGWLSLRPRRPGVWGKSSAVAGADVWQPLEPARQVPVPVPQELHRRRQQYAAHQGGIEEDRDREAEAELLEDQQREGRKDREHGHHHDGRAGDDTGGALDAV